MFGKNKATHLGTTHTYTKVKGEVKRIQVITLQHGTKTQKHAGKFEKDEKGRLKFDHKGNPIPVMIEVPIIERRRILHVNQR